jgi:predicted nucleotidyltransferase
VQAIVLGRHAVDMAEVTSLEMKCVRRYVKLLGERLGDELLEVRIFGSAARGDMWPPNSPMHSDIDLLVITRRDIDAHEQDELVNETYPLFLEYGRQLAPSFWSSARWERPAASERSFREQVDRDGRSVYITPRKV